MKVGLRLGGAGLAAIMAAGSANAVLVYTGGTMTENFDGLPTTTQTGFFGLTLGQQTLIAGTPFEGTKLAGTGTTGMSLVADDGTNNSGAVHSLGAAGSGERALGLLASGTNIPGIGVEILNGTGLALTSMTITFTQENWRSSTSVQNTMAAAWGRTGGGMTSANYLTSGSMTAETSLDLVGPAPVTTNGALNGNDPSNQAIRTHTFTFSTPLAANGSFFLRWQDINDAGNDADLAIDNLSVSATAVPEPATFAMLGLGLAALARRRRRNR